MGSDEQDGLSPEDLFQTAMGKVIRLDNSAKIHIEKPAHQRSPIATRDSYHRNSHQSASREHHTVHFQSQDDPWILMANGVSREKIKRLAAGTPQINQHLDLHGVTRNAALALLQDAVQHTIGTGERVICVVHGRGLHSQGKPILKHAVYHWLREGPWAHMILAAIPQTGSGGGACLILLRREKNIICR